MPQRRSLSGGYIHAGLVLGDVRLVSAQASVELVFKQSGVAASSLLPLAAGSLTGKLEATIEITVRWGNICRPDFLGDVWLAQVQNNVERILDKLQGSPPASLLVLVR